jgi:hypothetical protein
VPRANQQHFTARLNGPAKLSSHREASDARGQIVLGFKLQNPVVKVLQVEKVFSIQG